MGNCFKVQFEAVLNNDSLPIFGYVKIIVKNIGTAYLRVAQGGTIKSDSVFNVNNSSTTIASGVTEWTLNDPLISPSRLNITTSVANQKFLISKYKLFGVVETGNVFEFLLDDILYVDSTIGLEEYHGYLDAAKLENKSTIGIIRYSYISNISDVSLPALDELRMRESSIVMNIEDLDTPAITIMDIGGSPGITGDLKVWAEKMRAKGRVSGNCQIGFVYNDTITPIEWDGVPIHDAVGAWSAWVVFSSEGVSIVGTQP